MDGEPSRVGPVFNLQARDPSDTHRIVGDRSHAMYKSHRGNPQLGIFNQWPARSQLGIKLDYIIQHGIGN